MNLSRQSFKVIINQSDKTGQFRGTLPIKIYIKIFSKMIIKQKEAISLWPCDLLSALLRKCNLFLLFSSKIFSIVSQYIGGLEELNNYQFMKRLQYNQKNTVNIANFLNLMRQLQNIAEQIHPLILNILSENSLSCTIETRIR